MLSIKNYKLQTFLIIFFSCNWIIAQNIKIEIEKETYKKNERIEITFKTNVSVDSIEQIIFPDFKILNIPAKFYKTIINKGKMHYSYTITYLLMPKRIGTLKIESPTFFTKEGLLKGKETVINVIDTFVSTEESQINKKSL